METQALNNSNSVYIHSSKSDEERLAEEREIDAWLPITSNRNTKWWYSAFHNVTAMVGAGILSLPYAMAQLGWGPGVAVLVTSWIITLYTLWQMVEMHEIVPGKRFDRYHELGQHAFGKKLGLWIIVPQQLVVEVGTDIVYMVTGGESLQQFYKLVCRKDCKDIKKTYFIMIFASVHFVMSHLPDLNSIAGVSLAAAVMSIRYAYYCFCLEPMVYRNNLYTSPRGRGTDCVYMGYVVVVVVVAALYHHVCRLPSFGNSLQQKCKARLRTIIHSWGGALPWTMRIAGALVQHAVLFFVDFPQRWMIGLFGVFLYVFRQYLPHDQHALRVELRTKSKSDILIPIHVLLDAGPPSNIVADMSNPACAGDRALRVELDLRSIYHQLRFNNSTAFSILRVTGKVAAMWSRVQALETASGRNASYSTIAWGATLKKGELPNVEYGYKSKSTAGTVFNFFTALGDVAFAYAGHNVVLEIQATIPSTPEKPSRKPMWKGVIVAYLIVALCYFPVAIIGYWRFGNQLDGSILDEEFLNEPTWLIAMANIFVVVHVIGSYQGFDSRMGDMKVMPKAKAPSHVVVLWIYAMPVFDMIETVLVRKFRFKPTKMLRFVTRNIYVAFTMFVGITFPFFIGLLGFFGGFAFAPTTYFLPCIMWLIICKPKKFSLSWIINWICIILGVLLMVIAPIGGLRSIIIQSKDYKFYS